MKICPKYVPKVLISLIIINFSLIFDLKAYNEFVAFEDNTVKAELSVDDEFEAFNESEVFESEVFDEDKFENTETKCNGEQGCCGKNKNKNLYWVLGVIAFTILSGFLVRFRATRNLRGLFLIAATILLGFYRGACPCPISSFQNLVLAGAGVGINWQSTIWFLALIPVTYLFGRVYCGWICHLGALQEFIFLPVKIKIFQNERAQKNMRVIRIALLVILIVQLFITKTNIFIHYDPFKVAFNLIGTNTISWVLLGLLLLSSIFIYRPFCKAVCPIGLMLGWVSKIPGASVIGSNEKCTSCKKCDNSCKIRAITRDDKLSRLDNQECIGCGDCMNSCHKNALGFFRNNKKTHHDQIICKSYDK